MSRIEADHLAREAIVYVRQSTVDQVNNNVESRRGQYGLVEQPGSSAGPTSASSTTISAPPASAQRGSRAAGCDLRRPGRRGGVDGGLAPGPQRA